MVCKVLVIDDAVAVHRLIRTHLSEQRFEVISAYDGKSGLAVATAAEPDLILLDVDMPVLNGYEVCRRLKANSVTRPVPVLFLTAAATVDQKVRGLDVGACDYIAKPFEPAELRARVRAALRTRNAVLTLAQNSMIDELTGLFDRKYFEARLDAELASSRRSGLPLGCAIVDIDHMASVNGAFGRELGDDMLHAAGEAVLQTCRREDVVCRRGGDEFAILAAKTDMRTLHELADRVCAAVRSATLISPQQVIQVTASVGAAVSRLSEGPSIVQEAEAALRTAQQAGGDCARTGHELTELRMAM